MARLAALVAVLLLALAAPASAHDADAHTPPDRVGDLRSALIDSPGGLPPGVEVQVLQNGEALWLRNSTRTDVVVLDPDGAQRYQIGISRLGQPLAPLHELDPEIAEMGDRSAKRGQAQT